MCVCACVCVSFCLPVSAQVHVCFHIFMIDYVFVWVLLHKEVTANRRKTSINAFSHMVMGVWGYTSL